MFKLVSSYQVSKEQGKVVDKLNLGLTEGAKDQVLMGVTGSGKTFMMANLIAKSNRPAIIMSHNKTLAAQLYNEMQSIN